MRVAFRFVPMLAPCSLVSHNRVVTGTGTRRHRDRRRQNDRGIRHRLPGPDRYLRPDVLTARRPGRRGRHPAPLGVSGNL